MIIKSLKLLFYTSFIYFVYKCTLYIQVYLLFPWLDKTRKMICFTSLFMFNIKYCLGGLLYVYVPLAPVTHVPLLRTPWNMGKVYIDLYENYFKWNVGNIFTNILKCLGALRAVSGRTCSTLTASTCINLGNSIIISPYEPL